MPQKSIWEAAIGGAARLGTTALGVFGGGGKSARQKASEAAREAARRNRKVKIKYQTAASDIEQLYGRLMNELTAQQARRLLDTRAKEERREWRRKWVSELENLPNGVTVGDRIAEQAQQTYLDAASTVLAQKAAVDVVTWGGLGIGLAGGAYYAYKES